MSNQEKQDWFKQAFQAAEQLQKAAGEAASQASQFLEEATSQAQKAASDVTQQVSQVVSEHLSDANANQQSGVLDLSQVEESTRLHAPQFTREMLHERR